MRKFYTVSTPIPFTSCVIEESNFNEFINQISSQYEIVKEYDHWYNCIDRHIFETKYYAIRHNDCSPSKLYVGSYYESFARDELKFKDESL